MGKVEDTINLQLKALESLLAEFNKNTSAHLNSIKIAMDKIEQLNKQKQLFVKDNSDETN